MALELEEDEDLDDDDEPPQPPTAKLMARMNALTNTRAATLRERHPKSPKNSSPPIAIAACAALTGEGVDARLLRTPGLAIFRFPLPVSEEVEQLDELV